MDIKPFKPNKVQVGVDRREVAAKSPEIHISYDPGEVLFSQGDLGGDLFFVESGSVEIYITKNGQDISLAMMGVGEIIGVMTLLTAEPRLAAARAKEKTIVKKIPRTLISKVIATFPKWLNIVLKEFTARINEMNRRYSETLLELKQARETQITTLFLASQMAQALVIVGRGIVKNMDGVDLVFAEEIQEKMELVLNQPREVIASIWQVFTDAGLIKIDIEPERKRKVVPLERLDKVSVFTQFVRESGQGSTRKILKAKFKHKELQMLTNLVKFVIKQGASPDKSGTFLVKDISPEFENKTTVKWDADALVKPAKLGLLVIKGAGDQMSLTFTPASLGRTLGCVSAMRRFLGDEDVESEMSESPATVDAPSDEQQSKAS